MNIVTAICLLILITVTHQAVATELGVVYPARTGEELKADLKAMKEAGITAILMGESPFVRDWPTIREAVVEARAQGMKVTLLTSTDWFPPRDYDGIPSSAVNPENAPPLNFSYASEPAKTDVINAINSTVRRFRMYDNVFYLNLVNEIWAWEDHSVWAEEGFRKYLRNLNPEISYWNKRWETEHKSFDTIVLPGMPDKGVFRNDYDIYRSDEFARFYASVYDSVRTTAPPHWLISSTKIYPNYYSNHIHYPRWCALDFYKLFREHPSNEAWSCHEYGWGSIAARASKSRTVRGVWGRPVIVTESWGNASDDIEEAHRVYYQALRVFKLAKMVYDPDVLYIYKWDWIRDKPEWRKQIKEEIVPILREELGVPVYDDLGILDARVAHYDYDPESGLSYWRLNELTASAGLLPIQVYMNESQAYSLGKPAFDTQPSLLLIPEERGLYPESVFEGYKGKMQRFKSEMPDPEVLWEMMKEAGVKPLISEFSKPSGVYEQLYRKGDRYVLAVYNSTDEPARVSYVFDLTETESPDAHFRRGRESAHMSLTFRVGSRSGSAVGEVPAHGVRFFRM